MRIIIMISFIVTLAGCATSKSTYLPDGSEGHSLDCSGLLLLGVIAMKRLENYAGHLVTKLLRNQVIREQVWQLLIRPFTVAPS
jgi:hypothetical protein